MDIGEPRKIWEVEPDTEPAFVPAEPEPAPKPVETPEPEPEKVPA
jgi:hypothetical protein